MKNTREKINDIISKSNISDSDKDLWEEITESLANRHLELILDAIESDQGALQILTENMKDKIQAINSGNKEGWAKVIAKEKEILKKT